MVESTALEMRHTGNCIGGSNPSLSANAPLQLTPACVAEAPLRGPVLFGPEADVIVR